MCQSYPVTVTVFVRSLFYAFKELDFHSAKIKIFNERMAYCVDFNIFNPQKKEKKVKDKRCTIVFFLMYLLWLCAV